LTFVVLGGFLDAVGERHFQPLAEC